METVLPNGMWFDLDDPESPELDDLAKRFGLHELQVEDCRHRPQRCKAEDHEHYKLAILKQVRHGSGEELIFDDVDLFLGPDFLISVRQGEPALFDRVRARAAEEQVKRLDWVFYMIADEIVDGYQPVLDWFAEEIDAVEDVVLEQPTPETLARIFALRRSLIDFRRAATGVREVINSLTRREKGLLGEDLGVYLRDVYDHTIRTVDIIETFQDLLAGTLDIYMSAVANRTNEVMKVLTIWGTVALPLLIITGFFGMNLGLPWMHQAHGVVYAVGLMGASSVVILAYFKWKRWY